MDYEGRYLKKMPLRKVKKRNFSDKHLLISLIPLIIIIIFFFFYFNIKSQYLLTKILKSSSLSDKADDIQLQSKIKLNSNDLESRIKLLN